MSTILTLDTEIVREYSIYLTSKEYKKLLVIQSKPEQKIWFKDKEIDSDKLKELLIILLNIIL